MVTTHGLDKVCHISIQVYGYNAGDKRMAFASGYGYNETFRPMKL